MHDDRMLILKGTEVQRLLANHETLVIQLVQAAYEAHRRGESSLPYSTFLRFSDQSPNRIIALPAYLAGDSVACGVKWIASFPANLAKGLDRASAVIVLNDHETGRPKAILEGSIISAQRTAASAALAARTLHPGEVEQVVVIGCGLINFEIQRFFRAVFPTINRLLLYDLSRERAAQFGAICERNFSGVKTEVVDDLASAFSQTRLVTIATTAIRPYLDNLAGLAPGSTILHISLRDLVPELILSCDNVVDDIDHVCRAQTSIHLAEQATGSRHFIRCTIADVTSGAAPPKSQASAITVFSPFGLGILDMALSEFVYTEALRQQIGTVIDSLLPPPWTQMH